MAKKINSVLKLAVYVFSICCVFNFIGCSYFDDDVSFSRRTITQLVKGHFAVRHSLDWPHLKMLLYDVGAEYSKYTDKNAKLGYERSFISNFARGFAEKKANLNNFFNWRQEKSTDPKLTVVSANFPNKNTTFYFMISRQGVNRKLVSLQALHNPQLGEKFKEMPKTSVAAPSENEAVAQESSQ